MRTPLFHCKTNLFDGFRTWVGFSTKEQTFLRPKPLRNKLLPTSLLCLWGIGMVRGGQENFEGWVFSGASEENSGLKNSQTTLQPYLAIP